MRAVARDTYGSPDVARSHHGLGTPKRELEVTMEPATASGSESSSEQDSTGRGGAPKSAVTGQKR
jgi:hypothetical protein